MLLSTDYVRARREKWIERLAAERTMCAPAASTKEHGRTRKWSDRDVGCYIEWGVVGQNAV